MGRRRQQGRSGAAAAAKESGRRVEKEKEVREEATAAAQETPNEKEKQKGKEAESKNAGRQFFKVFFPEQSGKRLKIPPPFHQYLQDEPTGLVSLKSPSGNTWQVALTLDSEGFCFVQGWKEFVRDHSLKQGHFLVFTYDGRKQFSVAVFCSSGVEDPTARAAQLCNNIVVKVDDDKGVQGGKQLDEGGPSEVLILPVEEGNGIIRKRTRGKNDLIADGSASKQRSGVQKKAEKKRPESSKDVNATKDTSRIRNRKKGGPSEISILPVEEGNGIIRKRTRGKNDLIADGSASKRRSGVQKKAETKRPESSKDVNATKDTSRIRNRGPSEISILPVEEGNGIIRKRTRGKNDLIADGSASKRRSGVPKKAEKKRPEFSKDVNATKDTSRIRNRKKDTSISLLNESVHYNKIQIRDKDVPRTGKFIVKRARQPVVISQRRPVTEEEKNHALTRAKEFKSKNPFTVQIMMESYVYVGFFMNISCEFVRESLPRTSKKMTLWDPQGKPWEVNYVYYSDRSVGSFSGGWRKFALGNNLEKFDVCIFELFKEDNIRVHIYRVVPEITPLLRASNK